MVECNATWLCQSCTTTWLCQRKKYDTMNIIYEVAHENCGTRTLSKQDTRVRARRATGRCHASARSIKAQTIKRNRRNDVPVTWVQAMNRVPLDRDRYVGNHLDVCKQEVTQSVERSFQDKNVSKCVKIHKRWHVYLQINSIPFFAKACQHF